MNRVSVIIPCYNAEAFIDISIQSVFEQDYEDVELIVVNDGSTDHSETKILAWQDSFSRKGWILCYEYQENRGLGGAIDSGLKHVTGEYLTLLDADDYFLPDSFRKKAQFLDEHPEYVGVRSNGWMVRENEKILFVTSQVEKEMTDLFEGLLYGRTNNWAGSYMIRTNKLFEFYPDRNIYPSRYGQNMQILLPVSYQNKFGFIDEPLMAYVLQEDSHSQARTPEEQYQKDEANQRGYRDIYLHMLQAILKNQEEYQRYCNIFNASYYRCAMLRAKKYNKHAQLVQNYHALLNTGYATINDRICYYDSVHSPLVLLYKGFRKIKNMIER